MINIESIVIRKALSMLSPKGERGCLSTLMFHKIPSCVDPLVPDELCLDEFEIILDFLQDNMKIIPLSDAVSALDRGTLPERAVSITFDDGYGEWIDNVSPLLLKRNIPATFFITTESLSGPTLWHERIVSAVRALPNHGTLLPYGFGGHGDLSTRSARIKLIRELQERLKYAPLPERLETIKQLENQAIDKIILPKRFDANDVKKLHAAGFDIGAHTIRHPILNECSEEEAINEIAGCREELASIIGGRIELFAYPNGRPERDFSSKHVRMVKNCGYKAAVTSTGGAANSQTDRFLLPRTTLWASSAGKMAYRIGCNILTKDSPLRLSEANASEGQSEVKCLLVASTFPPIHGGSAVVYANLCEHMPKGSIRVLAAKNNYLTHQPIPGWDTYDKKSIFPIDRLPYLRPLMLPPPRNSLISIYRLVFHDLILYLRILLSASRIVHAHNINIICVGELVTGSWLGLALRKLFGCKLIIYVHGEEVTTHTTGRLHGNRRRYYLQSADKVISVSSFTCDALTEEMGLPSEAIALVPNGVDTDRFTPGEPDGAFISAHGLSGKRLILTVGRLVPRKGMDMAIRAMPNVIKKIPNSHYLIVGDGEYRDELSKIINQCGVEKNVTLLGKVDNDDLLKYLRACEIFIMPNRTMPDGDTEGFGLVFREANACNKPVIGGRAGGAVEAVVDGHTGLLVDGNEPSEISEALTKLLSDELLAKQMGAIGLKLALENNTKAVAEKFLRVCERLLAEDSAAHKY